MADHIDGVTTRLNAPYPSTKLLVGRLKRVQMKLGTLVIGRRGNYREAT